jgi:hypothetical protein
MATKGEKSVVYISGQEAAKRLGVAPVTISRVARRAGIGVFVETGKLAALATTDLPRLRPHINAGPGNPEWIAQAKAKRRRKKTPA